MSLFTICPVCFKLNNYIRDFLEEYNYNMSNFENHLLKKFELINEWLKFAETKNAIFMGFSGAGITAILTFLSAASNVPKSLWIGLCITVVLLSIIAFICSISFLPNTNLEKSLWKIVKPSKNVKKEDDNLYYFGHIQKYSELELLDSLNKFYFNNEIDKPYQKKYIDISSQIVVNSVIAYRKFRYFSFSVYVFIFAIFAPLASILVSFALYRHL